MDGWMDAIVMYVMYNMCEVVLRGWIWRGENSGLCGLVIILIIDYLIIWIDGWNHIYKLLPLFFNAGLNPERRWLFWGREMPR